jgi:hypothetical protein
MIPGYFADDPFRQGLAAGLCFAVILALVIYLVVDG